MILFSGFRKVCPIHFHFLLLMLSSIRHCCVLSHRSSFEITSGQRTFRIFLKHLLIKVCSFLVSSFVDLHVSEPYRRTDFTFVLKILSFVCNLIHFSIHTAISIENVNCAFLYPGCYVLVSSASFTYDAFQICELRHSFNSFPMKFQRFLLPHANSHLLCFLDVDFEPNLPTSLL